MLLSLAIFGMGPQSPNFPEGVRKDSRNFRDYGLTSNSAEFQRDFSDGLHFALTAHEHVNQRKGI
jgi:hypothetical protein